jgi:hypothetical protein
VWPVLRMVTRNVLEATTVAVSEMQAQIDEARDVAAVLAHAYLTDNRPPREALTKARAWLRANQEAADD